MKIIENSDTFTQIVNSYKREKKHCGTNMILMQNQIDDLIDSGKLYYDVIEGVLWFFEKNEDYYTAYFYLPKEERLRLIPQDLDVIVEVLGNKTRYNSQWEAELLEIGFEKYKKYFESEEKKEEYQDSIEKQKEKMHQFVERKGCYCRNATKEDYDVIYQLWNSTIDKYAVHTLTDNQIDEMEKNKRGFVILNDKNEIIAASFYSRAGSTAFGTYSTSLVKGFGAVLFVLTRASAFQEGCNRIISWAWEYNKNVRSNKHPSLAQKGFSVKTGKFFQQFLLKKAN